MEDFRTLKAKCKKMKDSGIFTEAGFQDLKERLARRR